MRNLRRLNILLVMTLLLGMLQTTITVQSEVQSGIHLVNSGANYIILEGYSSDYNLQRVERGGGSYTRLQASGADNFGEPGHPELPVYTALIGVPADAKLEVRLVEDISRRIRGSYLLAPAGAPSALEEDLQPGEVVYEPDLNAYRQQTWLPGESVQLDAPVWVGNQRIARVSYYPFEYQPTSGKIIWHPEVRAEIHLLYENLDQSSAGLSVQPSGNPFETSLANSLLNYEQARGWRSFPLESNVVPKIQSGPVIPGSSYRIPNSCGRGVQIIVCRVAVCGTARG